MATTQGVQNLVTAFTGGQAFEDAAFDREANRILQVQNARAALENRLQDAFLKARQNEQQQGFDDVIRRALADVSQESGVMSPELQAELVSRAFGAGGFSNLNTAATGADQLLQTLARGRVQTGRLEEGFTPANAAVNAFLKPELTPGIDKVGDLIVRDQFTANPEVDPSLTAINAAAGASTDRSGLRAKDQRQIDSLMRQVNPKTGQPFTRTEAENLVFFTDLEVTPAGEVLNLNKVAGSAEFTPITGGTAGQEVPLPPPGESLFEQRELVAGPTSGLFAGVISPVLGIAGINTGEEFVGARQQFRTAINDMVRALSINPKFPVGEIKQIRKEIDISPRIFDSSELLGERMISIDRSLRRRLSRLERNASDLSLDPEVRADFKSAAVSIRDFLAEMNVPQFSTEEIQQARQRYDDFDSLSELEKLEVLQADRIQ